MRDFLQNLLDTGRTPLLMSADGNTMEVSSVNDQTAGVIFKNGCYHRFSLSEIDNRLCDGRLYLQWC